MIMLSKDCFKAKEGKFRVIGVDTFDYTDWIEGDFDSKKEAFKKADEIGGNMLKTHVYDYKGNHLYEAGKF